MTDPDSVPLGTLIRQYRLKAGLSQEQLADRSGLSARAISDLERGLRKTPHPETLRMLADGLALGSDDREALLRTAWPDMRPTPLASLPPPVADHGLPVTRSPLIGREQEVADLVSWLRGDEGRLTTLTGPGGVGKTRLALEAARLAAPVFADGVVFVDLAPITDAGLVGSAIAQALGVQESGGRTLWDALGIAMRHRRHLLMLDNFEQVIEAAPDVAALLVRAPELRVLVTSREILRVRGEHEVIVQPLELPSDADMVDPEHLKDNPAAALFVQVAWAVKPGFTLSPENAPAVAEICRRLDGLPLAIELAASRIKHYPPATLLENLDRRLPILSGGPRDAPARQQTLRGTIAWSYGLLTRDEQALFRRLGVFAGGASVTAIQAVIPAAGTLELNLLAGLASLVDKSLLRERSDHREGPRFSMLEILREFALDALLQAGEAERVHQALAEWVLSFVMHKTDVGYDPLSFPSDLTLIDEEFENIRLAFAYFGAKGDAEAFARLFTCLIRYLYVRGLFREALSLGQRALELAEHHAIPDHLRGIALSCLAIVETMMGHVAKGEALGLEGLSLLRGLPEHRRLIPEALLCVAIAMREQERYAEARVFAEEAYAVAGESGDLSHASFSLYHIGRLAFLQNDLDRAAACLGESLKQGKAAGRNETIWSSAGWLAAVHIRRGALVEAAESLREADRVWREIGSRVVSVFLNVSGAFVAQVQPVDAVRIYGAVAAHLDAIGADLEDEPWIAKTKSDLRAQLGDEAFEEAFRAGRRLSVDDAVTVMRDVLDQFERSAAH